MKTHNSEHVLTREQSEVKSAR